LSLFQLMLVHTEGKQDYSLLPPAEQEVLRRATRPKPPQRFPNTLEMVRALRAADRANRFRTTPPPKSPSGDKVPGTGTSGPPKVVGERLEAGQEPVAGYRLVRRLGRVGFGEVWEAKGPGGMQRALTFIRNLDGQQDRQVFRALDLVRELDHAHLVRLHGYWVRAADGAVIPDEEIGLPDVPAPASLVVATDLASKNLLQRWQEGRERGEPGVPLRELIRYVREAADGIDYLNAQEPAVVHRDIKPENLLLTKNDRVKVNFGLAELVEGASAATRTASAGLTAHYAAPELFHGTVSRRTDQYSLALTYYRVRTGRLPFAGNPTQADVIRAHTEGRLDLSGVGEAERAVLARATAVDPDDRYGSCTAMAEALNAALGLSRPLTPLPPTPSKPEPPVWIEEADSWLPEDVRTTKPPTTPSKPILTPSKPRLPEWAKETTSWPQVDLDTPKPPPYVPPPPPPSRWAVKAAVAVLLLALAAWGVYHFRPRPPIDPVAALQERVGKDVDGLLEGHYFGRAAAAVRDAVTQGAGTEWAEGQHERVRGAWRQFAEERQPEYASLREYRSLLTEYPDDQAARTRVAELEVVLGVQERREKVEREVDNLLKAHNFPAAVKRIRAEEGKPADAPWIEELHRKVRGAWRLFAGSKPEAEEVLELKALLAEYKGDSAAQDRLQQLVNLSTLRDKVTAAVSRLVGQGDYAGAAGQIRNAEDQGADAAWTKGLYERVRKERLQAAAAKRTVEAQLNEYEAILAVPVYRGDPDAQARVKSLRAVVAQKKQLVADIDKLLGANDFAGAVERLKSAEAQPVDPPLVAAQRSRVRDAWRAFAAGKTKVEDKHREYVALLKAYPDDTEASAQAELLKKKLDALVLSLGDGVTIPLVEIAIPPGGQKFQMGSPLNEPGRTIYEGPWQMTLKRGYYLGETEVTVGQFRRFARETNYKPLPRRNPPLTWDQPELKEQSDNHPVVAVTWTEAVAFCKWLSAKTGRRCRLPTEVEWEYAARAGKNTVFANGNMISPQDANFECTFPVKDLSVNGQARQNTAEVRQYPPNAWGLYDVHGNAAEWCADVYQDNKPQPPGDTPLALVEDANKFRTARGGSWRSPAEECRCAYRWRMLGSTPSSAIGFRICVEQ
jgi:formylglycine-generating enzyme required for sulfatase activity/serine/threonine protein kinase